MREKAMHTLQHTGTAKFLCSVDTCQAGKYQWISAKEITEGMEGEPMVSTNRQLCSK